MCAVCLGTGLRYRVAMLLTETKCLAIMQVAKHFVRAGAPWTKTLVKPLSYPYLAPVCL